MKIGRWSTAVGVGILLTLVVGVSPASAATPTHVGEDPYTSGCIYNGGYIANSGVLKDHAGHTVATVQNWYSTGCVTNWAMLYWNNGNEGSSLEIFNYNWAYSNAGAHVQDYPAFGEYYGSPLPMWTNMIEGVDKACVFADHSTGNGDYGDTELAYGTINAVCA